MRRRLDEVVGVLAGMVVLLFFLGPIWLLLAGFLFALGGPLIVAAVLYFVLRASILDLVRKLRV